jgi:hypothetical protein
MYNYVSDHRGWGREQQKRAAERKVGEKWGHCNTTNYQYQLKWKIEK